MPTTTYAGSKVIKKKVNNKGNMIISQSEFLIPQIREVTVTSVACKESAGRNV